MMPSSERYVRSHRQYLMASGVKYGGGRPGRSGRGSEPTLPETTFLVNNVAGYKPAELLCVLRVH